MTARLNTLAAAADSAAKLMSALRYSVNRMETITSALRIHQRFAAQIVEPRVFMFLRGSEMP